MNYAFSGPLHQQVLGILRNRISAGEWGVGHPIPSESLLSKDLGVSLGTVRKAMDRLVRERVIMRKQGRGTFVNEPSAWQSDRGMRLVGADGKRLPIEISLVKTEMALPSSYKISMLAIKPSSLQAPKIIRIIRNWKSRGKLICVERIAVEASKFPNLVDAMHADAETLHQDYEEVYKTPVERLKYSTSPISAPAPDDLASALEGDAFMKLCRIAYDANGLPIEYCMQVHACSDNYMFQIDA